MTLSPPATAPVFDCRQAFAEQLAELARADERIVAVVNDSVGSSNLVAFQQEFPDRLINVGIAEQNMVGVGAGLANAGIGPVRLRRRAVPHRARPGADQDRRRLQPATRRAVRDEPGDGLRQLGPTHHSIEDLSWMRAVADLSVVVPADPDQTRAAVRWAAGAPGPVYLRVPRFKVPAVSGSGRSVPARCGMDRLRDGAAATVIATGTLVTRALAAAEELRSEGLSDARC